MRPSAPARFILMILFFCPSVSRPSGAATHLVRADGSGEYPTIQAAIDASVAGDTVALENGLFTEVGNRDVTFRGKPVVLRSSMGDPSGCIIDAEGSEVEEHRGLLFVSGETSATVIDGITIQGGYSIYTGDSIGVFTGGGVLCRSAAWPTIRNCVFRRNYASDGGALYLAEGAHPTIEECRFEENTALSGGAIWSDELSPPGRFSIRRSVFVGNSSIGHAGALNASGHVEVTDCFFLNNQSDVGGGFHVCGLGAGNFSRCTFIGNVATYGGAGST